MNRVILVRHGEPDQRFRGHVCGSLDIGLSPRGRLQAEELAEALAYVPIEAIYTSPLRRAVATAEPLARRANLRSTPVEALREMSFGDVEGLSYAEIQSTRPELFESWMTRPAETSFPGGESFTLLRHRAWSAVDALRRRHGLSVVVAHSGVIRAVLASVLDIPGERLFRLEQPYLAVTIVDWAEDEPLVMGMNVRFQSSADLFCRDHSCAGRSGRTRVNDAPVGRPGS